MKIIRKEQGGGALAPFASYVVSANPSYAGASKMPWDNDDDDSKKKKDEKEKGSIGLLTADMVKLLTTKALPSDVEAFVSGAGIFEQSVLYDNPFDPQSSGAESAYKYPGILRDLARVTTLYDEYKSAMEKATANGSLHEVAVNEKGELYVVDSDGSIHNKSVKEVTREDKVLTNADLAAMRRDKSEFAFDKYKLTATIANSVGVNTVVDWVSNKIKEVGKQSYKRQGDILITGGDSNTGLGNFDAKRVALGIDTLMSAASSSLANVDVKGKEIRNQLGLTSDASDDEVRQALAGQWASKQFTADGLYKVINEQSGNKNNIKYALNALLSTMPTQYRTLLEYKAKMSPELSQYKSKDRMQILMAQITQAYDEGTNSLSIELSKNPTTGDVAKTRASEKKSPESSLYEKEQSSSEAFALGLGGTKDIELNTGGAAQFRISGIQGMPMNGKSPLGYTTISNIAKSNFAGVVDLSKASVGGARLSQGQLAQIGTYANNIISADLPYVMKNGVPMPDMAVLQNIEAAQQKIKDAGLEMAMTQARYNLRYNNQAMDPKLVNKINSIYQQLGLPILLDRLGRINLQNYMRFAVMSADIPETMVPQSADPTYIKKIDDINEVNAIQNRISKESDKLYQSNTKGKILGLFNTGNDVYRATVFAPIDANILRSAYASGDKINVGQSLALQGMQDNDKKTLRNPGTNLAVH